MNLALFGGTFDPIHRGHLAVARAAREQFNLGKVLFVPADVPPHKQKHPVTTFEHRYAMVVLATQDEKGFVPSLLEAPPRASANVLPMRGSRHEHPAPSYSINTVRRLKQELRRSDRLYFLIGMDAFLDVATWHQPEALFAEVEFIVASRPGYSLADVARALPPSLRPRAAGLKLFHKQPAEGSIVLPRATLHLLTDVQEDVSATAIRAAAQGKRSLERYVEPSVAAYIRKMGLYAGNAAARQGPPAEPPTAVRRSARRAGPRP